MVVLGGYRSLIAGVTASIAPLGVASLLNCKRSNEHSIAASASKDPFPHLQDANFCCKHGGELASSWRNLGSSLVGSKQKAPETLRENYCEHCCVPWVTSCPRFRPGANGHSRGSLR